MDSESIAMTEQMKETLAGLTDKLERLEHQVSGTVNSVKNSVTTVRNTFDLKLHVRKRPWTLVGGAAALGFIVGARASRRRAGRVLRDARSNCAVVQQNSDSETDDGTNGAYVAQFVGPPAPSWLTSLGNTFEPEIAELKGIAIGMLIGLVREIISNQTQKRTDPAAGEYGNITR